MPCDIAVTNFPSLYAAITKHIVTIMALNSYILDKFLKEEKKVLFYF